MEEVYSETVIVKFLRSDPTLSGSDPMKSANINALKTDLKEKKDALKKVQKKWQRWKRRRQRQMRF